MYNFSAFKTFWTHWHFDEALGVVIWARLARLVERIFMCEEGLFMVFCHSQGWGPYQASPKFIPDFETKITYRMNENNLIPVLKTFDSCVFSQDTSKHLGNKMKKLCKPYSWRTVEPVTKRIVIWFILGNFSRVSTFVNYIQFKIKFFPYLIHKV